jgi:hypothetical protein
MPSTKRPPDGHDGFSLTAYHEEMVKLMARGNRAIADSQRLHAASRDIEAGAGTLGGSRWSGTIAAWRARRRLLRRGRVRVARHGLLLRDRERHGRRRHPTTHVGVLHRKPNATQPQKTTTSAK